MKGALYVNVQVKKSYVIELLGRKPTPEEMLLIARAANNAVFKTLRRFPIDA